MRGAQVDSVGNLVDLCSPLLQSEDATGVTSLARVQRVCQMVFRLSPARRTLHEKMVSDAKLKIASGSYSPLEMTIDRRKAISDPLSASVPGQQVGLCAPVSFLSFSSNIHKLRIYR